MKNKLAFILFAFCLGLVSCTQNAPTELSDDVRGRSFRGVSDLVTIENDEAIEQIEDQWQ